MRKYGQDNGFKFKIKVRSRILNFISVLFDKEFNSHIDNNLFITLHTNHINNILNYIDELTESFHNFPTEQNKMLIIKYIIYLEQSVSLNNLLFSELKENKNSILLFKIIEYYYTLFKSILKTQLYHYIIPKYKMLDHNFTMSKKFIKNLNNIFIKIFGDIQVFSNNKNFISIWANNKYFYDTETFNISIDKYGEFKINNEYEIKDILTDISQKVEKKIKELESNIELYDTELPDKFNDPIMSISIKIPIEIPSVHQIVDKYTIYNHLFFNETNPFTNEKLTILDLENYNNKPEVKERMEKFINDFNEWKLIHKK